MQCSRGHQWATQSVRRTAQQFTRTPQGVVVGGGDGGGWRVGTSRPFSHEGDGQLDKLSSPRPERGRAGLRRSVPILNGAGESETPSLHTTPWSQCLSLFQYKCSTSAAGETTKHSCEEGCSSYRTISGTQRIRPTIDVALSYVEWDTPMTSIAR